jgi:hypothetical protein
MRTDKQIIKEYENEEKEENQEIDFKLLMLNVRKVIKELKIL